MSAPGTERTAGEGSAAALGLPAHPGLTAFLLALVTCAVFGRVASNEFVNYDVGAYVLDNPMVNRGLTVEGLVQAFTRTHSANWHPLTWISHMVDVELFGLTPRGPHLENVGLHALAAALLFLFLWRTTRRYGASLAVAALFALHPLRVESVAWIAERKDVLAGLFWMLGLLAWARYAARPTRGRYAAVLVCLLLGLLSKPMLVTFPCVLVLMDLWPLRRWRGTGGELGLGALVREKLPLLLLVAASAVVTLLAQRAEGVTHSLRDLTPAARLANAGLAAVIYPWKALWPSGLAVFHPHPALVVGERTWSLWVPGAVGGATVLALSVLAVIGLRRAGRSAGGTAAACVGWLWYVGTLVPVVGLVQVGHQSWADRYAYVPVIGFQLALVFALDARLAGRARRWGAVALGVALAVYAGLTWRQIGFWRNSLSLWERCLAVTEKNYMAHHLYGTTLAEAGRSDEALREFEASLAARPSHFPAHHTWAQVLDARGELAGAERHWLALVRLAPGLVDGHYGLGRHYAARELYGRAVEAYRHALALDPARADVRRDLGLALAKLRRFGEAEAAFRQVLAARPDDLEARYALAVLAVQQGRPKEAVPLFEQVLARAPRRVDALTNLGAAYAALERWQEAFDCFTRALAIAPNDPDALRNLAVARRRLGR